LNRSSAASWHSFARFQYANDVMRSMVEINWLMGLHEGLYQFVTECQSDFHPLAGQPLAS
jgi:hypothetical protein